MRGLVIAEAIEAFVHCGLAAGHAGSVVGPYHLAVAYATLALCQVCIIVVHLRRK